MSASDWQVQPLGGHVSLISGQHIEADLCTSDSRHLPYLTGPADFPYGKIVVTKYTAAPKVMCRTGDVLVTVKGSGAGKIIVSDSDYCISRQLMAVRAESCSDRYLRHILESFAESLRADASGLIPGISRADILTLKVGMPPLCEQLKIANILDTIDEAIRKTEQLIAKLEQVKQGLLHDLLTRGIDDNGELRDPVRHPEQFKDSVLGRIPREWQCTSLSTVLHDIRYGTSMAANGRPDDTPVLRIPNVQAGYLDLADLKYLHVAEKEFQRFSVSAGDILVIRTNGNRALLGRCAHIEKDLPPCMFASYLIRLRLDKSIADSNYVSTYINSRHGRVFIERQAATSAGNYNINTTQLRRLPFLVPPKAEQDELICRIVTLKQRSEHEASFCSKLRLLKQGLMEDLLTGRVRVTPLLDQSTESPEASKP